MVQAAASLQQCPVMPPGMWTLPVAVCPMPAMTFLPVPVHGDVTPVEVVRSVPMLTSLPLRDSQGLQEELLSPGSSPRGSPSGALSFATVRTPESSLEAVCALPKLASLASWADLSEPEEELVSPGSSPRGSLCGAQSFATESTAEGRSDSFSDSDEAEAGLCEDEVEVWSVSVKNTFVDVTMVDYESASPSSRQRRRSTPAVCRARVMY